MKVSVRQSIKLFDTFLQYFFTIYFYLFLLECWQHEQNNRPDISEVISELNFINPENEDVSAITLKKSENGTTEDLCLPD